MRAVRMLAYHYHASPDRITEEELRQYLPRIKNVKNGRAPDVRLRPVGSSSSTNVLFSPF